MDRTTVRNAALDARHWDRGWPASERVVGSRSLHARASHAAGESWRKWEGGLDPRYQVKSWVEFKAGMLGFWLTCASLGALVAVMVRY